MAIDRDMVVRTCSGDVDGSGDLTAADVVALRAAVGQAVGPETARYDVNGSGEIIGADVLAIERLMP